MDVLDKSKVSTKVKDAAFLLVNAMEGRSALMFSSDQIQLMVVFKSVAADLSALCSCQFSFMNFSSSVSRSSSRGNAATFDLLWS